MTSTLSIPPLTKDLSRILIDADTISRRVDELAHKIDEKYRNLDEPLILVGVLKGSFIFMADLSRKLTIKHVVDFIAISSYGEKGDKRGEVRLLMDTRENLADHHVLIVEDILDSGNTLSYLIKTFKSRGVKSIETAVFLDKPERVKDDKIGNVLFPYGVGLQQERDPVLASRHRTARNVCAHHDGG